MSKFDPFSPSGFLFSLSLEDDTTRNRGSPRIPHIQLHGIDHKSCADCGSLKPLDQFSSDRSRIDGLRPYCKSCESKQKEDAKKKRIEQIERSKEEAKKEWDDRDGNE